MNKEEKFTWLALGACAILCTISFVILAGVVLKDAITPLPTVEMSPTSFEDEDVQIIDANFCRKKKPQQVQNAVPPMIVVGTQQPSSSNVQLTNIVNQVNENESKLQGQIDALTNKLNGLHDGKDGIDGKDGKDGVAGTSPTVAQIIAGLDMSQLKGKDGKDGVADPQSIQTAVNNYITQNQSTLKGKDGKDGIVDYTKIDIPSLLTKLPPFYVRVIDPNGTYTTTKAPVHLGEQMNLILSPTDSTGVSGGVGVQVEGAKDGGGT